MDLVCLLMGNLDAPEEDREVPHIMEDMGFLEVDQEAKEDSRLLEDQEDMVEALSLLTGQEGLRLPLAMGAHLEQEADRPPQLHL